ncbi:hypothetical protein GRJ2_002634500 [Grus japonensis]|uniref:Uncharacterized protein n=1 Tax=Grus japonensis TaxID=30415 RepID=A0ABC9XVA5_GRUJA
MLHWMFKGNIPSTHHTTSATWSKWVALITQRARLEKPNHPGILEEIMDWPEGRDFGALPEEVAHAQEAPPYNELPEDERRYALFTDGVKGYVNYVRCFALSGQVLVVVGGDRGGFCEKLLEASPGSDRANASWLQDGPASGQGQASQCLCDNIFKKENKRVEKKKSFCNRREEREDVRNSADTKVSAEGGGGGAPGAGAEIPLQPVVKTMVKQAVPLQQPMEEG